MLDVGLFVLRVAIGLMISAHGGQKLFGWFGGQGMNGWTGMVEKMRMRPTSLWAWTAAGTEFLGGLALAAGFMTPVAGAMLFGAMLVAALTVHLANGFWNTKGGIEFPLTNGIACLALAITGPGAISVDTILGLQPFGPYLVVVAMLFALAGVVAALESRHFGQRRTRSRATSH
ncbi:MAG: putative oxidoreductase [Chloroflexota bacterium]|jgi:putative oxidoreductase|nr:putative oxidoreductase [Chloroflexota bacterium]